MLGKIIVIVILVIIILSLGSGLYYLVKDTDNSDRTVKALTIRIILSFVLVGVLFLLYWLGILHPHSIYH